MQLTKQQKKTVLHSRVFPNDIEAFCSFFFPHHFKKQTPSFHRELFSLYQDESIKRIAIGAPRGHAKSTVTDLGYLAWAIVHEKTKFVLLVSDTYTQATLFLETLKAEFESNDRLRAFYGDLMTNKWSEGEIIVGDTMVKAVGAGMKVRGLKFRQHRPDLIIVDDLENDELVESQDRRAKLERWFNAALIPSMGEGGRIVVIGTILHFDSLLSKMLDEDTYREFDKRTYRAVMDGKALWPEHLDLEELEKIKQGYLEKGLGFQFHQEYMNDPVSDENRKFKIEKIKYFEEDELNMRSVGTYITIDRAYSTQKTADWTGIIVNSVDNQNNWFIRQAERFKGNEKELIDKIFDLYNYWKPYKIAIEQKAYEYTLKHHLEDEMKKRNLFFLIEPLSDGGKKKTLRIEGLVPRFETGSVFLKRDQMDLIDELIRFPRSQFDDLSDALAYQLEIAEPVLITSQKKQKKNTKITQWG